MDEQLSLFDPVDDALPPLRQPGTLADVQQLWNDWLEDGDLDEDAFTWDVIRNGISFAFYGTKVLELRTRASGTCLGVRRRLKAQLFTGTTCTDDNADTFVTLPELDAEGMQRLVSVLKAEKERIFADLDAEPFGCCNDFVRCSDAQACLYPKERFALRCYYRQNLEAGRIFYGKNKNYPPQEDMSHV